MIYAFIQAHKANQRVSVMCRRTLKVSNSGFYDWRDRAPSARAQSDALLTEKISRIHRDSTETYGAPRIHFELKTLGVIPTLNNGVAHHGLSACLGSDSSASLSHPQPHKLLTRSGAARSSWR